MFLKTHNASCPFGENILSCELTTFFLKQFYSGHHYWEPSWWSHRAQSTGGRCPWRCWSWWLAPATSSAPPDSSPTHYTQEREKVNHGTGLPVTGTYSRECWIMTIKINKWGWVKHKSFCTAKKTTSKMKKEPTEWEKIFANEMTNKGLIPQIYKWLLEFNIKTTTNKNPV